MSLLSPGSIKTSAERREGGKRSLLHLTIAACNTLILWGPGCKAKEVLRLIKSPRHQLWYRIERERLNMDREISLGKQNRGLGLFWGALIR